MILLRTIFIISLVLFSFVRVNAQGGEVMAKTPHIDWGERFTYRGEVLRLIDIEGRNFALAGVSRHFWAGIFPNSRKLHVQSISALQPTSTTTFRLKVNGRNTTPTDIVEGGNNQLITIGKRGRWFSNERKVYYHNFNRQGTDREVEGSVATTYRRTPNVNFNQLTGIKQSDDFSKSGIHYSIPVGRNDFPGFGYVLFDEMKGVYDENLAMLPFRMNEMDVYDHFLTNDGEYYMVGKEFTGRNIYNPYVTSVGRLVRSRLFNHKEGKLEEISLNINAFIPQDLKLYDDKEEIIMTGFYAEDQMSDIRGVFFIRMNKKTNEITYQKHTPFSSDFISAGKAAWDRSYWDRMVAQSNRERNLNNFKVLEMRATKDNGYVVVAEHQEVDATLKTTGGDENSSKPKYDYNYYFDDLLVYKLDGEGELLWVKRIPKSQQSQNDQGAYLSTLVAITDENVHLFFNDSQRNYDNNTGAFDLQREFPFPSSTRGILNVIGYVKLDLKEGNETRSMMPGRSDLRAVFIPKKSRFNVNTKELYLYANLNNRHRLGYAQLR